MTLQRSKANAADEYLQMVVFISDQPHGALIEYTAWGAINTRSIAPHDEPSRRISVTFGNIAASKEQEAWAVALTPA